MSTTEAPVALLEENQTELSVEYIREKCNLAAHNGIRIYEEHIVTPELAEEILEELNLDNRDLKNVSVTKLMKEFEAGHAGLTNDMMCFSKTSKLLNGQHRANACKNTGISFPVTMAFGFSDDSVRRMDSNNTSRTILDVAHFEGIEIAGGNRVIWFARLMLLNQKDRDDKNTRFEHIDFIERYSDQLRQAAQLVPFVKGLTPAPIGALVARAIYNKVEIKKLELFLKAYISGIVPDKSERGDIDPDLFSTAHKLRNIMLSGKIKHTGQGKLLIYLHASYLLGRFLDGKPLPQRYQLPGEIAERFPIPEDRFTSYQTPKPKKSKSSDL